MARPKGSLNKVTADVKRAAAKFSPMALKTLAQIAETGESEAARVAAANAILDRAHGKAAQSVELGGKVAHTHRIERVIVDANPSDPNREGIPPAA